MKTLKILGLMAVAATALMAFAASASATTLEVNGVTQNNAVTISASLEPGTSALLSDTSHNLSNTCTEAQGSGTTTVFTGTRVSGPGGIGSISKCDPEGVVVVNTGSLEVEAIAGTTNGTVFSKNAEVKVPTTAGITPNCKTGAGVDVGILTGATTASNPSKFATMDIKAVLNCGFLLPSALLEAAAIVTNPEGLAVSG